MKTSASTGMIYLTISTMIFMVTGYITNLWLGRHFGPEIYGAFGVVISIMGTLNLFQTSGLPQALSKFLAEDEKNSEAILKSGLVLQIYITTILTIAYLLLSYPIAVALNDVSLIPYLRLSSLVLPFYAIFSFYTGYFNGKRYFKSQSFINIIYSLTKVVAVILFAYFFKLYGAIAGFIAAPMLIIFYGLPLPKKTNFRFPYKKLILFSIPLLAFVFLSNLQQTLDLYLIKSILRSDTSAGYYTVNQSITRLPFIGFCTFIGVLFPTISRNVSQNLHEKSRQIIHQALRIILLLLIPLTLLISATSSQLIQLLYSDVYLPASPSLSILIVGFAFLTLFTILANILNSAGQPGRSVLIAVGGVAITFLLCLILIPKMGLVGAALSTSIGSLAAMIIAAIFVYHRFQALVAIPRVFKITLASLVIYAAAKLYLPPLPLLPLFYVFLFGVYFLLLTIMKELTQEDFRQVRALIPARIPLPGKLQKI